MKTTASGLEVMPAKPSDTSAIATLMERAFGGDLPCEFLNPAFLEWKYFTPRPGWTAPRSYVVQSGAQIAAHGCLWPCSFTGPEGPAEMAHIIDWVADPAFPGAGSMLYRHMMQQAGTVFAIGGSAHARRLLPKLGFAPSGVVNVYAKPVRPWAQFLQRPATGGRQVAQLARNLYWSLGSLPEDPEWAAQRAPFAGAWLDSACPANPRTFCRGPVSAALVNYVLACPLGTCSLFSLARNGEPRGYFLLADIGPQCRIIDISVDSEELVAWQAAYLTALWTAAARDSVCEVVAVASLPWVAAILRSLGFHLRDQKPVALFDPLRRSAGMPPFHLQMVHSDAFCVYSRAHPFLT